MAKIKKLGRISNQRKALLRNQASYLLWHGKIRTTEAKAKALRSYVEKILTMAINTYEDTVKIEKDVVNAKGDKENKESINDWPNKLNARRKMAKRIYKVKETKQDGEKKSEFVERTKEIKDPLMEKIFNVHAPKYAERKKESGTGGGYTRILKVDRRKGDNSEMAIIELV